MKITLSFIAVVLATANILAVGTVAHAAGTAAFSASANPSSITVGSNTTFSLYENGDNVNVVTGNFSYDSSKLQFVSTSCAGNFSSPANTSSSVASCFVPGGATVSGSQLFASVTFKSIAAGSATLTITGSQIASAGANVWNGVASSATVNINAVVATPTPTSTPVQPTPTPVKTTPTPTKTQATPTPTPSTGVKAATTSTPTPTPSTGVKAAATSTPTPTPTQNVTSTPTPTEGQVKGVQASNSATPTTTPSPMVKSSHNQTPWIVGIIAILIIAAAGGYFLFRNKKVNS